MQRGLWAELVGWVAVGLVAVNAAEAQVRPDATLGAEISRVRADRIRGRDNIERDSDVIEGGARRGGNLFHSFEQFDVSEGRGAYFNSPADVRNIFSRVMGADRSEISGTLGVLGDANLFFMNPNGILFGSNASLDLSGSFIATTANSIQFGAEGVFSAADPEAPALLTVNPSALFFNSAALARPVIVQANLHLPAQTLALIGGNLLLTEATVKTEGGRIELGSITSGTVGIVPAARGWSFSYSAVPAFQDLQVHQSRLDASGSQAGTIVIRANQIKLTESSQIAANTEFAVANDSEYEPSGINLQAQSLLLSDGSVVEANTSGIGNAGDISITVLDSITIEGISNNAEPSTISSVVNLTGIGDGGAITLKAANLRVRDLGVINTSTLGQGNAGNIRITANRIRFDSQATVGAINSAPFDLLGIVERRGGDIVIRAHTINVAGGAQILTSTSGQGPAGNIRIQARGTVRFDGADRTRTFSSAAFSNVDLIGIGQAGNIDLQAGALFLTDSGQLLSSTSGQGDAGDVSVHVERAVVLDHNALIQSGVNAGGVGQGGNVLIQADSLSATNGSQIQALVFRPQFLPGGQGNGGNIRLDINRRTQIAGIGSTGFSSGLLTLSERDAFGGAGNITVNTDSLQITDGAVVTAATFNPGGDGGDITVNARTLEVLNGGQILTNSRSERQAGQIRLSIADTVMLSGADPSFGRRIIYLQQRLQDPVQNPAGDVLSDVVVNQGAASGIYANTDSAGSGGRIILNAQRLSLNDHATITAQSSGSGTAGSLNLNVGHLTATNSRIATSAQQSSGGNIDLEILRDAGLQDSTITTNSGGDGGDIQASASILRLVGDSDLTTNSIGNGGNITLRANAVLAFGDSDILARSQDQRGGNIVLDTPAFFGESYQPEAASANLASNDRVDLSAQGRLSNGAITTPDVSFIQNSLVSLPTSAIDTENLLANSCIARSENGGTFLITGTGGLPPNRPGSAPLSSYPTDNVRTETDANWQPGDPIIEPQGVYRLPNGELVLIHDCKT